MTARQALRIAMRSRATALGRKDIGSLEPGKCADIFAVNLRRRLRRPLNAIRIGRSRPP
jgi:imidazolonepropionase-like amidohydrolase